MPASKPQESWSIFPSLSDDRQTLRFLEILDPCLARIYDVQPEPPDLDGLTKDALAQSSEAHALRLARAQDAAASASRARERARAGASYPDTALATSWEKLGSIKSNHGPWFLCDRITKQRRALSTLLESSPDLTETDIISKRLGARIRQCCESILYAAPTSSGRDPLIFIASCNSRFCTACAIRRSLLRSHQAAFVASRAAHAGHLTHAVFTVPNCKAEDLRRDLLRLKAAFHRLLGSGGGGQTKPLPPFHQVSGWMYSVEVTYNSRAASFHPHIHALLDTPWLAQAQATVSWADCCIKQGFRSKSWKVYLNQIKPSGKSLDKALVEATKYLMKPLRCISRSARYVTMATLISAFKSYRSVESSGSLSLPPLNRKHVPAWTKAISLRKILELTKGTDAGQALRSRILATDAIARVALKKFPIADLVPGKEVIHYPIKKRKTLNRAVGIPQEINLT